MSLAFIVGVAVISAVFLTIAFKLDQEHGLLRFAFILFAMGLMFLIPASLVHDDTTCDTVIISEESLYVYGNNFTGYHWDYDTGTAPDGPQVGAYLFHKNTTYDYGEHCYNVTSSAVSFVKAVKYPYWLFIAYLVVYLFYKAALALGNASKDGKLSRFFKGWK
jgi:hypothetical protein